MTSASTAINIFRLPSSNLFGLNKSVEKINRRANKLGAPLLEVEVLSTSMDKVPTGGKREFSTIRITGDVPTIDGWKILAAIDHVDGFNIVKNFPGVESVPSEYRERKPFCDHCHTRRVKKYSFVIQNVDTGETKQVGKSCLKDFFDKDISAYVSWYGWFNRVQEELSDPDSDYYGFNPDDLRYPIEDALAVAFYSTRKYGYKKSSEMNSTKDDIGTFFFGDNQAREAVTPEKQDFESAQKALDWVKNADASRSDFIATVQDLVKMEDIQSKHFGYAAGIVPFFTNSQKSTIEVRNEWYGKAKQRLTLTLRLKSKQACEGFYGVSFIHKFVDTENRMFVWFASNDTDWDIDQLLTVKATIKEHDEFRGVKQTKVNRVTQVV